MKNPIKYIQALSAAVAPAAAFFAIAEGIYKHEHFSRTIVHEWVWYFAYILSLAIGLLILSRIPFQKRHVRALTFIVYIVIIVGLLMAINLFVACSNGDCL